MMRRLFPAMVVVLVAASAPMVWAQPAPTLSPETMAAADQLGQAQRNEVDAFVRYHLDAFIQPVSAPEAMADAQPVLQARQALESAGTGNDKGLGFRRYFAESVTREIVPVVLADGSRLGQVNAAVLVGSLRQPVTLPALEAMVRHPNPAVRYHGMRGYRNIRALLLGVGGNMRDAMFRVLTERAGTETDALVLAELLSVLDLSSGSDLQGLDSLALNSARQAAQPIVTGVLASRLQGVRNADLAVVRAYGRSIDAVEEFARAAPNAEQRRPLLTLLADILANASAAYADRAVPGVDRDDPTIQALGSLLKEVELTIGRITNSNLQAISSEINRTADPAEKVQAIQSQVDRIIGAEGTLTGPPWNLQPPQALSAQS